MQSLVNKLVDRDTVILEKAAAHVGYDGWRTGVEFQADAAALRARRIVAIMLAKEAGRPRFVPAGRRRNPLSEPNFYIHRFLAHRPKEPA